jgi:hypothetical protein
MLLVSVLAVGSFACNDDPDQPNNGIQPGEDASNDADATSGDVEDDTSSDATDDTGNDTDSDVDDGPCAGISCDLGEECKDGECVPQGSEDACDIPRDLGTMATDGSSTTVNLNMENRTDSLQTECGASEAPEAAIKFRTEGPGRIDMSINSGVEFGYEIRTANCENSEAALACLTNDEHFFYTTAGLEYYLIFEPRDAQAVAPVEVTLTATEAPCAPPGASTCNGDTREICFISEGIQQKDCAASCNDGFCEGDTCAGLIDVAASMSFSADSDAYRDRFNFEGDDTCSSGGSTGLASPGYDVAFQVTGLTAGQSLTVDASNTNADNYIFVLDACNTSGPCVTAQGFGSKLSNWEVPSDGDYVVVVDQSERANVPLNVEFDIQ